MSSSELPQARSGRGVHRRRRQPYVWLGAGALTLGVGLAGAGTAQADDNPPKERPSAAGDATGGRTTAIQSGVRAAARNGTAGHAQTRRPPGPAYRSAKARTLGIADPAGSAVVSRPTADQPGIGRVKRPGLAMDPADFGPILATVIRWWNDIEYITRDVKPVLNPFQLPSAPSQGVVAGTLNAYNVYGAVTFAVAQAPLRGTVALDQAEGAYVYTPDATLAATGGTDTFAVTATDAAYHPLATLFGVPAHATTVQVPVSVTATPALRASADTGYYISNTSYQPMQIAGYSVNEASLSPAVGQVLQSPATAATSGQTQALFEIDPGKTVTTFLNPVGIIHEGVVANYSARSADAMAITSDGDVLYVTNAGGTSVTVLDPATGLTTSTINVGSYPYGIALTPDNSRAYVSNNGDSSVSVIDTASRLVTATIQLSGGAYRVAVSPDGRRAYVTNSGANTVSVINTDPADPSYNTVAAVIGVGVLPSGVAVSPDSTRVYVTNFTENTVSVIDAGSNSVVDKISGFNAPFGVAVNPSGSRIYVTETYSIVYPITIVNYDNVKVVDAATRSIEATIKVGDSPIWVAVSPDGNQTYVTNALSNTMSVINTDVTSPGYNTVVNTVPVGVAPQSVVFRPDGTAAYVANNQSNTVSKIVFYPNQPTDGGTYRFVVTMTGGSAPSCASAGSNQCPVAGSEAFLEDPPGTTYYIPSTQPQQQSDVLQNLVSADLSNATFLTKSEPRIGYTNPLKAQGFSPYVNNTTSPSTSTYTVSTTTTTASSSTWNVSVKLTQEYKMGGLTMKAEEGAAYTWGTTTTNSQTYTQAVTQTVQPGQTLYLYTETPVYRFYGDWNVTYGNTTYYLQDVWYDTPYAANSLYPSYLAAYTCETGSPQCTQLASGNLSGYPDSFPTSAPTYPVAESDVEANYNSAVSPGA